MLAHCRNNPFIKYEEINILFKSGRVKLLSQSIDYYFLIEIYMAIIKDKLLSHVVRNRFLNSRHPQVVSNIPAFFGSLLNSCISIIRGTFRRSGDNKHQQDERLRHRTWNRKPLLVGENCRMEQKGQ